MDAHHLLCILKFQMELPSVIAAIKQKLRIPVFVALGTEDTTIGRSWLLEYCYEKYRGSLKVRREDILAVHQNKSQSKSGEDAEVDQYLRRLQSDPEALAQIEEENLLQVKGAAHHLFLT